MGAAGFDRGRRTVALGGLALAGAAAGLGREARAQAARAESEVVLGGYGGTYEQFTRNQLIPMFEKATGIKVRLIIGTALAAGPSADVTALKARVDKLAEDFPLYPDLDQIH